VKHFSVAGQLQVSPGALAIDDLSRLDHQPLLHRVGFLVIGHVDELDELAPEIHELATNLHWVAAAAVGRDHADLVP